jgi:uncharacterized membrane protein YoaK (UPF0700 family)
MKTSHRESEIRPLFLARAGVRWRGIMRSHLRNFNDPEPIRRFLAPLFSLSTAQIRAAHRIKEVTMSNTPNTGRVARFSTETKAAFKTTEFIAYVLILIAMFVASAVVDNGDDGQGFGANAVWLYATILTVGYMISRGLAKSGSREHYDADDRDARR